MARIRVRRRAQAEEEQMLDITPLIDIVFIMLIFFIVTASFVKESGLEVEQPQAETASQKTQTSILVGISANGDIWINHQPVDLRAVRAQILRLHAETPQGGIVIQADKNSRNETLVQVMDQIRQAGVRNISIAARPDDS